MEQRFNLRWHLRALCGALRAYSILGRWEEAVEEGKKALKVAEEFSDNSQVSYAAWQISEAYSWRGDLDRAIEYGELAVEKASTPADKAWAGRSFGWALCRAGETKRGIEHMTRALRIVQAGRFMPAVIPTTCNLGEGYWLAGEADKARQTLEEALEIADRCGARYYVGWAQRLLGEIALKQNLAQAAPHFEESIAVLRELKAENELALAYAGYGRFHKQQGQVGQARDYLTKALEIFERLGTLIEPDKVKEELAKLPKKD
jgi:tetratricopeptide (TPR) repeat protein